MPNAYHKQVAGWVISHPELFVEDRRMQALDVLTIEEPWKGVLKVARELHAKTGGLTAEMVKSVLAADLKAAKTVRQVDAAMAAVGHMTVDDYELAVSDVWLGTRRLMLMDGVSGVVQRLEQRSDESVLSSIAHVYDVCGQVQQMSADEGPEVLDMADMARNAINNYDKPQGIPIPTGFAAIDAATFGGMRPGNLWLLAGYSSQGKTYCAREISFRFAHGQGKRVLFISLEMDHSELQEYFLARTAWQLGVPYDVRRAIQRTLHEDELSGYTRAIAEWQAIRDRLVVWVPERDVDADDVSRRVEIEARRAPIDLVVVDYSELMRSTQDSKRDDYRLRLGEVIRGMKALARRARTRVLLLHQTSREGFAKALKRGHYVSSELAETGQAERHADVVMWVLRSHEHEQRLEAKIGLAKTRIGDASCRHGVEVYADYSRGIIADLQANG